MAPGDSGERRRLDSWCAGVGQPVVESATQAVEVPLHEVAFVSWNVHVGNGDIRRFLEDLRSGRLTGRAVQHFVLMLQEVVRASGVPPLAQGASGASMIRASAKPSNDIVDVARELGLSLVYVPSMRNGNSAAEAPSDRGNAILSTLPLDKPVAIELWGERQRRVAVLAQLLAGRDQAITVGAVHLDALGTPRRLWVFWTPWMRERQVKSLGPLLPDGPIVLGADLNTWHGAHEPAVEYLSKLVEQPAMSDKPGNLRLRALDYLFFRAGAEHRARYEIVDNDYGSDHKPLIGWISGN